MRTVLILFLMFLNSAIYSQIFNLGDPIVKGPVEMIIEKSNRFKNDWREYSFDSISRLKEKKSYRDGELLEDELWSYRIINDSLLESTQTIKSRRGISIYKSKYFYDSRKRIIRYEEYKQNSNIPYIVGLNAIYENDKIKQYNRILIPNDTSVIETYKFEYINNRIIVKKSDNKNISRETCTLKLNRDKNLIDKVVDYNDPLCVLAGIRTYSHLRRDKYEMKYKYDKCGNWIQSYSITRFWKYRRESREIKYKL